MSLLRPLRAIPAGLALVAAVALGGCVEKAKECHAPYIECGGRCVDGSSDLANCGGCGVSCGPGLACCGSCVDLTTSAANCSACGHSCAVNGVCTAGTCSCPPALPDACGIDPGACVNLATGDGGYCGRCGDVCQGAGVPGSDATCVAGTCVCTGVATDCGNPGTGQCVNTSVDEWNCGTCGHHCPPRATCSGGTCGCDTASFPDDCGVAGCVNFQDDPANCNGCGAVCTGATPSCSSGKCCPSGTTSCSGTCIDTRTNDANCGACGSACGPGRTCSGGTCVCGGPTPLTCGGSCCAGTGCCAGGACQTGHSNGLGQSFLDCTATYPTPDTTTKVAALAAADAWSAGTTYDGLVCDPYCIARQTSSSCAVWCYGASPRAGRVNVTASLVCTAACPDVGFATWP